MVREFLSNDNASKDHNVLGVNYNGSVGEAFYHPYGAVLVLDQESDFRDVGRGEITEFQPCGIASKSGQRSTR